MSLDWNLEKIENADDLCWTDDPRGLGVRHLSKVTEMLIFGTLAVGLSGITAKNETEFYARYKILFPDHEDVTPVAVHAHLGLQVNGANETRATWMRSRIGNRMRSYVYDFHAALMPPTADDDDDELSLPAGR